MQTTPGLKNIFFDKDTIQTMTLLFVYNAEVRYALQ